MFLKDFVDHFSKDIYRGFLDCVNQPYSKEILESYVEIFQWMWNATNSPNIHLIPHVDDCWKCEPLITFLKARAGEPFYKIKYHTIFGDSIFIDN